MRTMGSVAAAAIGMAALVALAGCGKPKARAPVSSEGLPPVAQQAVKPAAQPWKPPPAKISAEPLPKAPGFVGALLGKPVKASYPQADGDCVGNTDIVDVRYQGATPGVMIEGWGWDRAARQAVARVVLVDKDGQVVGGGETGTPRPDVTAANKFVTSTTTGWKAVTPVTSGVISALGVVGPGRTCPLGTIDLGR